ncbi:MAG: ribosome assembly factor SBDS [Thermoproteota archaeon]|nr:MAG: ribosome assembly factor SBDS [Candidatus Korarchaeota archaeon]RLG51585.1 MAG: ribosome assembly factor SBDS [Candidatus Korarchaeota archaeon]
MGEPVIARIDIKGKHHFEVYVYPEKAYAYLEGNKINIEDILAIEKVFRDARKGIEASSKDLIQIFGTEDPYQICKRILDEGKVQLTTEYLKKLQERKRRWIINFIHQNFVDPKTNLPHPTSRIERAMKEAKVRVDPYKKAEEQVNQVIEALRKILPLKGGSSRIRVKVPIEMWGKVRAGLSGIGKILREEMSKDGQRVVIDVEIPIRAQGSIYELVGKVGGSVEEVS